MVKKKVLVVRSASYYQFEKNLDAIKEAFPDARLTLLEHRERLYAAKRYSDQFERIEIYPSDGMFTSAILPKISQEERFDDAVIQYGNVDGEGYSNVTRFAFCLPADRLWSCNSDSKILPLTRLGFLSRRILGICMAALNLFGLIVLTPLFILAAPFIYYFKTKKGL